MESLYLLVPLSVALVLLIGAVMGWAVLSGQFDDLEREGLRVLDEDGDADALAGKNERNQQAPCAADVAAAPRGDAVTQQVASSPSRLT